MTDWHVHCVVVSYDRRSLTERTVESFLETVTIPHSLMVVDNGSHPDVQKWLIQFPLGADTLLLGENRYPGYAVNRGWEYAPDQANLLMRSDNDAEWQPGWCDEMVEVFETRPEVGQYGPIAAGDEQWAAVPSWPVGGNSVIRRRLYDDGLRYTETPWPELDVIEEHQLTRDVWEMGWERAFSTRPAVVYLDDGDQDYLTRSHADRGLQAPVWDQRKHVPPVQS